MNPAHVTGQLKTAVAEFSIQKGIYFLLSNIKDCDNNGSVLEFQIEKTAMRAAEFVPQQELLKGIKYFCRKDDRVKAEKVNELDCGEWNAFEVK